MKRHESLHALSQHHHFALLEALFIRRAREQKGKKRTAALRKVAEQFLQFWEKKGKLHFREEEELLLPAYASHVAIESDGDVMRMLAEHASIRARIGGLANSIERGEPFEDQLVDLGKLLHDHVRLEENVIFPRLEKTLTENELRQLGRSLSWLHPKRSCDI